MTLNFTIIKKGKMVRDVGGGLRGPESFSASTQIGNRELTVRVDVALFDGMYRASSVLVGSAGSRPISSDDLRQVPLQAIVREATKVVLTQVNPALGVVADDDLPSTRDQQLQDAAQVYRLARLLGEAPTKAVMDAKKVSRTWASLLVAEARTKGYLGKEEVGHAGGARHKLEG